jgi:cytochrome c
MKKLLLLFAVFAMVLSSCGDDKKKEVKKEVETTVEKSKEVKQDGGDLIAKGEKLFSEKTCATCHQMDAKVIGPSIKDIATFYKENNGNLMNFLKGTDAAIVDTDPGQVAIMKANLDGFVKDLSDSELKALVDYMQSSIN